MQRRSRARRALALGMLGGVRTVEIEFPATNETFAAGPDGTFTMDVQLSGITTTPLLYIEMRYRIVDASNRWFVRLVRNVANTDWHLQAGLRESGVETLEINLTTGIGTPDGLRVVADGNNHEWLTRSSGVWTQRGTVSSAAHADAILIGAAYTGATSANLLTNGDMEDGPPFTGYTPQTSEVVFSAGAERTGGTGLQSLQANNTASATRTVSNNVSVAAGQQYIVYGWIRGTNGRVITLYTSVGGGFNVGGTSDSTWVAFAARRTENTGGSKAWQLFLTAGCVGEADDGAVWLVGTLDDGATGPSRLAVEGG